jgi:hypothetical protein
LKSIAGATTIRCDDVDASASPATHSTGLAKSKSLIFKVDGSQVNSGVMSLQRCLSLGEKELEELRESEARKPQRDGDVGGRLVEIASSTARAGDKLLNEAL